MHSSIRPRHQRHERGLTLVELLVVVAIAAVLSLIAVPSLQASIQSNQLDTVSNQLLAALATARSEAVRAPDTPVQVTNPSGAGTDWKNGWATSTKAGVPLQAPNAVPGQLTVYSNLAGPVSFDPMGRLILGVANPAPTLVFVICADGVTLVNKSRAVIVSPSGRASIAHIAKLGAGAGIPIKDDGRAVASCTAP